MRIAILTSLFYHDTEEVQGKDKIIFGGAERYLYSLCELLQSEGHVVTVYQSLNQTVTDQKTGVQHRKPVQGHVQKNYKGIPITCLADTDQSWKYSTNSRLNMLFNEVSIHDDLCIYFATFLAWPHVTMNSITISHGIYWDYVHHFYATATEVDKAEFLRRHLYGFSAPDVCVAVDSNIRKTLSTMSPGIESRIQIIYNFVDTDKFVPKEKDWEGINVLYPRRLTVLRGCNEFIKSSTNYPDYNYLSVGQAAGDQLNESAKDWGDTRSNIKFISREMDDMVGVYQGADMAVVPTRACEGLSLSLLEAQSCGLPVITTNVGGLGDSVIHGYNALVYEPHHGGLGELIDYMAKDTTMRQTFGKRNRDIARECFDIKIWHNRWRVLLKSFGG